MRKIVASAARSRAAFDTIAATLDPAELGTLYVPLWDQIRDYYGRDQEARNADTAIITDRITGTGAGDKRQKSLRNLCEEVWAEEVSPANVADYVRDHAIDSAGMRLAAAIAGRQGRDAVEPLARAHIALLDMGDTTDTAEEEVSWAQVFRKRLDHAGRVKVYPKCLNERLGGGVYPGTNITVVGRPEIGKSALAVTMACGFVRQGLRGLWLTNEDAASVMMLRAACNLTNKAEAELHEDPDAGERLAISKGAANLRVVDIAPGTPGEIERYIKAQSPAFVVIDQIRNLRMKGATGSTESLDAAAQFVRAMGKKYQLITIGTTQAGDSASGKLKLELSDIDSSKTGIPGAADVIVMVGCNEDLKAANQRMLNLPKNKVSSRHEFWTCEIDPFRSKYRSIS